MESRAQVLSAAQGLKAIGLDYFRAGIWKPRTRPGAFEGVGSTGLPWLQEVQREVGLKVCIEVAKPRHIEEALKAGIDMLWVGAEPQPILFRYRTSPTHCMGWTFRWR